MYITHKICLNCVSVHFFLRQCAKSKVKQVILTTHFPNCLVGKYFPDPTEIYILCPVRLVSKPSTEQFILPFQYLAVSKWPMAIFKWPGL